MQYAVVCAAALVASGLTLFSGFGLGTLLMPVFAIFFPVELAVALTAIVHLLNNLFKLALLGKHAQIRTVLRFGLPALVAAFAGAGLLVWLSALRPLAQYQLAGRELQITAVKLIVAILMVVFALMELAPPSKRFRFKPQYLPVGGLLSGFFGGLSGHQGALRSAFLIKTGLSKEAFIATGVMIACLVDVTRLAVYGGNFWMQGVRQNLWLLGAATASAFVGAFVGARLLKQVTLRMVQILVAVMLLLIAAALGPGLI